MFALPGRLASSPALQRSGAFLHYVNDRCSELCDLIQNNVTRVYQELSSPVKQRGKVQDPAALWKAATIKRELIRVFSRGFPF